MTKANNTSATIKTIADFGFAAGRSDKGIAEFAAKYHALYVAATEEDQATMRRDYCHNYLVGKYDYTHAQVEVIAETKRTERSEEDQRAWNNAQSNFNYRVVNDCGNVIKAAHKPVKQIRVAKDLQATIAALVEQFGKDAVREAMKRV
jgi:archaellin